MSGGLRRVAALAAALLAAGLAGGASAATVLVQNVDAAGQGLNDAAPRAPVGNNLGTTLGQQRRIAYQFAADLWGGVLQSSVPIRLEASFRPLACTATTGTLGTGGASKVVRDFSNAPAANTWYPAALADALAGRDLGAGDGPAASDIVSRFNANIGAAGCLQGSSWYYGLDGNTPEGAINFVDALMHEIGHGLGFQYPGNLETGTRLENRADVFSNAVFDNVSGLQWSAMNDGQRRFAAVDGGLVWTGPAVLAQAPLVLDRQRKLRIFSHLSLEYDFNTADFGGPAQSAALENVAIGSATDGSTNPSWGCGPFTNAAALAGKVAMVDRGGCPFAVKAMNAQNAGVNALVVINTEPGPAPGMTGGSDAITIPLISLSQADGGDLRFWISETPTLLVSVGPVANPNQLAGADGDRRPRLYSPATLGSTSLVHFDASMAPSALMEPVIEPTLNAHLTLDLTLALLRDLGWTLNRTTVALVGCPTALPASEDAGLILGASVQAQAKACARSAANLSAYGACFKSHADRLLATDLLDTQQKQKLRLCTSTPRLARQFVDYRVDGTPPLPPERPRPLHLDSALKQAGQRER